MAEPILTIETTRQSDIREYERSSAVVFLRTKEAFGGLSNMASGFPLRVNGVRIVTSEALYQACRFPHRPEVQRLVIEQTSPMTAKMKTKPYRGDSRPDWDRVRVKIMRWCLRVKLAQNYSTFSRLLLSTGESPIVEESRKDPFWGAKPLDSDTLVGMNVLGRLLMELRKDLREGDPQRLLTVSPLEIPDFLLYGRPIETIQVTLPAAVRSAAPTLSPEARPQPPRTAPIDDLTDRMTKSIRKKLIEVSIPLEAINAASAREKSIRHGHPSTLHLWWARRPLAACRAVLFAQLVDDPSSWPERFDNDEAKIEAERKRLHKVIADMVPWEASNDEAILNAARWEIARCVAWRLGEEPPPKTNSKAILDYLQTKAPPVYDPFSGGGSIPLEAQRLGLRAYGSDLNPVAVLIGKALVEIPPKFAGRPPVNPKSLAELKRGGRWNGKGTQGLAEDVRYYGQWMRDEAEKRIGHLYPKAKLPDGSEATVIAWLWARTVRSPDPSAKGAMVPLISSFMLSTKEGKKAWVELVIDSKAPDGWRFKTHVGALSKADEKQLKDGTVTRAGGKCLLSGAPMTFAYIREQAKNRKLGDRLMAIVVDGPSGRQYLNANDEQARGACLPRPEGPEGDVSAWPGRMNVIEYGMTSFADMFTARQLTALTCFSDLVSEIRELALAHATSTELGLGARLVNEGTGAAAYADAIATYLAFAVSKSSTRSCSLAIWETGMGRLAGALGRQSFPMQWSYAETNPLAGAGGDIAGTAVSVAENLCNLGFGPAGKIMDRAAQLGPAIQPAIISTDPPYYDNIGYADLSDFFYVWLKRSLANVWPDLFRRIVTPKNEELVAQPFRHGSREKAEAFFMMGMSDALQATASAADADTPTTIYYAFKQSDRFGDGVISTGWATFLEAVVQAGFVLDGTWPVRTEATNALKGSMNALASSIVLVCRKRDPNAATVTRAEFVRILKNEMPKAIDDIRRAGVGPVDMQQSVIGPGMGVFSRYGKVLEDDDSAMSVKTALSLINRVWEEIENELDTAFDAETQVALAWFATYGFDAKPSGELITLANAKNVPLDALFASGVFSDGKGKAGLTARSSLPDGWSPVSDKDLTVWECVQHTARVLNAEDGGGEAAARLVSEMGTKAADARALAYRLFEIATKKGWAAEALVYNELAQEWPKLEELASSTGARTEEAAAQGTLQL
jgi:putative DNA methylase